MLLLGIDFGFQHSFIVEPEYSEEKGFIFSPLKFRNSKMIRNHAYFDEKKLIFEKIGYQQDLLAQNYISNLHTYIQMCYSDQSAYALNHEFDTNIYMNEDKEIVFIFKTSTGVYEMPIQRVLESYFEYLFKQIISPFNPTERAVYTVISFPNQYSSKHQELIQVAAKAAGFMDVRLISEQIAGILGTYNVEKFKSEKKRKFVVCNLDNANLDFCYIEYENKEFKVISREIVKEKMGIDIDEELTAIYREMLMEQNYAISMRYESEMRRLAQETKRYFYKKQRQPWIREFMGAEFYMDAETFEELICESFYEILEKTGGLLNTKIDYRKLDALIIGGSNSNFSSFCQKLENVFNQKHLGTEENSIIYAKGASLWALKSFTTQAHKLFCNLIDKTLPKKLKNSIGIKIGIKDLEFHANKIIIPKGTSIPYKSVKKVKLRFGNDIIKIVFMEGEHILPKYNRTLFELELKNFDIPNYADVIKIEFDLSIDLHLNVRLNLTVNDKKSVKYFKYVPLDLQAIGEISTNDLEKDLRMEYRAKIAQLIQKVEGYYKSLLNINIKKKFQPKYDKVIGYKSYVQNDFFDGERLKNVYAELKRVI